MTQASQWQQFVRSLQSLWTKLDEQAFQRDKARSFLSSLERFRGVGGWLMGLTGLVALLLWNWQLVIATGVGLLIMVLTYSAQQYRQHWHWQRWLTRDNRQLTIAVAGGGLATLSTYMATTVWVKSDDSWLAVGTILQGLGTLVVLLLLVWQRVDRSPFQQSNYHQMLASLTEADPLKRLIAVRQVTHWAAGSAAFTLSDDRTWQPSTPDTVSHAVPSSVPIHLGDCFRLMLSQETEPALRTALLDGLQALSQLHLEPNLEQDFGQGDLSCNAAKSRSLFMPTEMKVEG